MEKKAAGLRILVVEDEPLNALLCEEQLLLAGATHVSVCHDVGSALRALDQSTFDAAVVDFKLRGQNSLPVIERLEELHIPRVLVTGFVPSSLPGRYSQALLKPYACDELIAALDIVIKNKMDADRTAEPKTGSRSDQTSSRPVGLYEANSSQKL